MLFRRKNRIKVKVIYIGDGTYLGWGSEDDRSVWNCYGTTKESAKEMVLYRLKQWKDELENEKESEPGLRKSTCVLV